MRIFDWLFKKKRNVDAMCTVHNEGKTQEELEREFISDAHFQQCIEKMRMTSKILYECVNGGGEQQGQIPRKRMGEGNETIISFEKLIFDVNCSLLKKVREGGQTVQEKEESIYYCLWDICRNDEKIEKLSQYLSREHFLESIEPYDGDYTQDTYVLKYPIVVSLPIGYNKDIYPYDIRDLYIREM